MLAGVPATSLWALRAKAEEHAKAGGLFKDLLAAKWYTQAHWLFSESLEAQWSTVLQRAIALRTAQLDHLVRKHFQTFPEGLLLELGCGFSTRFSRLGRPGGRWYELDLPEMIELRASFGFPEARNHWHLAASLTEPDWPTWLPAGQAEALLIIAEGLLMYFPETEVRLLLQRLQQHFKGALIAFDVMGQWNLKAAQRAALETQSPIYWGVPDLRHCATAFGLKAAGELYLADYLNQTPAAQDYVSWLGHQLLRWPAWRARQGGTVLARL